MLLQHGMTQYVNLSYILVTAKVYFPSTATHPLQGKNWVICLRGNWPGEITVIFLPLNLTSQAELNMATRVS